MDYYNPDYVADMTYYERYAPIEEDEGTFEFEEDERYVYTSPF